jgi:hypothetical protein
VLGVDVGDAELAAAPDLPLIGRAALLGRADGRHRGGVHDTLDVRPQRLLEHHAGALHVDPEEVVGAHPQVRGPGDVEHARHPAQRPPDRPPVADVRHHRLDVEALQRLEPRGRAHGCADLVAARRERARDV